MFSKDTEARNRLDDLEDRFRKLSRDFEALELEWNTAYDKLRHMMGRVAKRAELLQKEMDGGAKPLSPDEEAIRDDLAAANGTPAHSLSPSQARLQAQIMKMRRTG